MILENPSFPYFRAIQYAPSNIFMIEEAGINMYISRKLSSKYISVLPSQAVYLRSFCLFPSETAKILSEDIYHTERNKSLEVVAKVRF